MSEVVERKFGGLTVRIDRSVCISSANCVALGEGLFDLDEDHICTFVDGEGDVDRDAILEACGVCPVEALTVIDERGKQIVP